MRPCLYGTYLWVLGASGTGHPLPPGIFDRPRWPPSQPEGQVTRGETESESLRCMSPQELQRAKSRVQACYSCLTPGGVLDGVFDETTTKVDDEGWMKRRLPYVATGRSTYPPCPITTLGSSSSSSSFFIQYESLHYSRGPCACARGGSVTAGFAMLSISIGVMTRP